MYQLIAHGVKVIFTLLFARPSRSTQSIAQSIGVLAGNGGWNMEDSNHYRA